MRVPTNLARLGAQVGAVVRHRYGGVGFAVLSALTLMAVLSPLLTPYGMWQYGLCKPFSPPSAEHIFGCDEIGRDLLTLFLYGSRTSLMVGFLAALLSVIIGAATGLLAGYFGGVVDVIVIRVVDALLAIPALVFMIVLATILGPSLINVVLVIGVLSWPSITRVIRSQVLVIKEMPYVEGARAVGAGSLRIMFKHILPSTTPLILANMVLQVSNAIIAEAALSFLGLGDPRIPSWGNILRFAFNMGAVTAGYWWYVLPPGVGIMLTVLSLTLIGYALDELTNPRLRKL